MIQDASTSYSYLKNHTFSKFFSIPFDDHSPSSFLIHIL